MACNVSVVIPTYNGAAYIEEALASVFAQTRPPAEVIVVDDCSTDETSNVVAATARAAPIPVRLVHLGVNTGGPAAPINVGVAATCTEFVAVLDQDDVFTPDKLERQATVLANNPDVALAASFCAAWNEPGRVHPIQIGMFQQITGSDAGDAVKFRGEDVLRTLILHGNFLIGYPAFMFRVADWRAKGGVDERLRVASDYDLLCWLCIRGSVFLTPAVQYVRREHDANVCRDRQNMFLDMARVRARYLAGQRWLLEDKVISESMQTWFSGFSYWLREAGNYRSAWECCRLAGRVWGWDWPLFRAACKLPLHRLWRGLTGKAPVYNSWTRLGPLAPAALRESPS